ncbi:MAG: hypothetical protein M3327_13670 [Actinomycetota bacterium]|nr:hypothetical protein [Actinomycetota bacterium]
MAAQESVDCLLGLGADRVDEDGKTVRHDNHRTMPKAVLISLIAVAVVLLIVGLLIESVALALIGLFGGSAVAMVHGLIVGGDWIREASRGRFRH